MYDKCYFCLDQLPKLKKESTASFFVNFGGAGVQKSRPTLLYIESWFLFRLPFDTEPANQLHSPVDKEFTSGEDI